MTDVYEIVTKKILEKLNQGFVPWRRPWKVEMPANLITGKPYKGVNVLLLSDSEHDSPYWLTFKQTKELDGFVKKGEKSSIVVFWKKLDDRIGTSDDHHDDNESSDNCSGIAASTMQRKYQLTPAGKPRPMFVLRYYNVFNTEQCTGLNHKRIAEFTDKFKNMAENTDQYSVSESLEQLADKINTNMPDKPTVRFKGNRACYNKGLDLVKVPPANRFDSLEEFYNTFFHELVHSTGHDRRLSRKSLLDTSMFGDHSYTKEELVAEIGAAFLSSQAGIINSTFDNSVAYLQSWIQVLQNDHKMIVHAASQAQKAAEYIMGNSITETVLQ